MDRLETFSLHRPGLSLDFGPIVCRVYLDSLSQCLGIDGFDLPFE